MAVNFLVSLGFVGLLACGVLPAAGVREKAHGLMTLGQQANSSNEELKEILVGLLLGPPPSTLSEAVTSEALAACREQNADCSRAVAWRKACDSVMRDPLSGESRKKPKGKRPDLICDGDLVDLDGEEGKCKTAFACVESKGGLRLVPGKNGEIVGEQLNCAGIPDVTGYKICMPDWVPGSDVPGQSPSGLAVQIPEDPELVEEEGEEIHKFIQAFEEVDKQASAKQSGQGDEHCVCNRDASKALLLSQVDDRDQQNLFVGFTGFSSARGPKIADEQCACLETIWTRWSIGHQANMCTEAPLYFHPVSQSWALYVMAWISGMDWFQKCSDLCSDTGNLKVVSRACDL